MFNPAFGCHKFEKVNLCINQKPFILAIHLLKAILKLFSFWQEHFIGVHYSVCLAGIDHQNDAL
jgi:hypothetical protein